MPPRPLRTLLAIVGLLALPCRAAAQCTTHTDSTAVSKSAKLLERCNDRRLRNGPGISCQTSAPPACAGTLVSDAIALAYGANNPPPAAVDGRALGDQLKCQKAIGKGVVSFIGKKLRYLIDGRPAADAEARARKSIDQSPKPRPVTVAQE